MRPRKDLSVSLWGGQAAEPADPELEEAALAAGHLQEAGGISEGVDRIGIEMIRDVDQPRAHGPQVAPEADLAFEIDVQREEGGKPVAVHRERDRAGAVGRGERKAATIF